MPKAQGVRGNCVLPVRGDVRLGMKSHLRGNAPIKRHGKSARPLEGLYRRAIRNRTPGMCVINFTAYIAIHIEIN